MAQINPIISYLFSGLKVRIGGGRGTFALSPKPFPSPSIMAKFFELLLILRAQIAFAAVGIKACAGMVIPSELFFAPVPRFGMRACSHAQRRRVGLKIFAVHTPD
jgi:hypothetical protein